MLIINLFPKRDYIAKCIVDEKVTKIQEQFWRHFFTHKVTCKSTVADKHNTGTTLQKICIMKMNVEINIYGITDLLVVIICVWMWYSLLSLSFVFFWTDLGPVIHYVTELWLSVTLNSHQFVCNRMIEFRGGEMELQVRQNLRGCPLFLVLLTCVLSG